MQRVLGDERRDLNKNTFLKECFYFSKKKKVSSKDETEKYRFAEKSHADGGIRYADVAGATDLKNENALNFSCK